MTLPVGLTRLTSMPYVLMYHSIDDFQEDPYSVTVRPETFTEHLDWLRGRGLRGVSVAELLAARDQGEDRGLVGLTFDDGYADFVTTAVPLLQRFGFTATVFVIADRLGGTNDWDEAGPVKDLMTAEQVREAADAGMEVGSHGLRHISLTEAGEDLILEEVGGSREVLSDLLDRDVYGFCYPYGHHGHREVGVVCAAGYAYGCAVRPAVAPGLHALARTYVGERDRTLRLLAKKVRHEAKWRTRVR